MDELIRDTPRRVVDVVVDQRTGQPPLLGLVVHVPGRLYGAVRVRERIRTALARLSVLRANGVA
jgi:hypothetical protein